MGLGWVQGQDHGQVTRQDKAQGRGGIRVSVRVKVRVQGQG